MIDFSQYFIFFKKGTFQLAGQPKSTKKISLDTLKVQTDLHILVFFKVFSKIMNSKTMRL